MRNKWSLFIACCLLFTGLFAKANIRDARDLREFLFGESAGGAMLTQTNESGCQLELLSSDKGDSISLTKGKDSMLLIVDKRKLEFTDTDENIRQAVQGDQHLMIMTKERAGELGINNVVEATISDSRRSITCSFK